MNDISVWNHSDRIIRAYRIYSTGGELRNILPIDFFSKDIFGNELLVSRVFDNPATETSDLLLAHIRNLPGVASGICMDFGAGYGVISRSLATSLPGSQVVSVDHNYELTSQSSIGASQKLCQTQNLLYVVADIFALPFHENTVNIGVSVGTVRYLLDRPEKFSNASALPRSHIALEAMLQVMKRACPLVLAEVGDAGNVAFGHDIINATASSMSEFLRLNSYEQVETIGELRPRCFHHSKYRATLLRNTRLYFLIAYLKNILLDDMIDHEGLRSVFPEPQKTRACLTIQIERRLGRRIDMDLMDEDVELLDLLISLAGTTEKEVHVLTIVKRS